MSANVQDLVELVASTGSTTVYPGDDALVQTLQARFRADQPYTRIGASTLVAVNPMKQLASNNDASAKEYEERSYKDTSLAQSGPPLQPHPYDQAARIYLLMRRCAQSQSVVFRGITGSGKTFTARLLTNQLLRLSAHSKKDARVAEQVRALSTVLDSFGNAKTFASPSASRHGRWTELHFNDRGRIAGAQALTWGPDKSRLVRLHHEWLPRAARRSRPRPRHRPRAPLIPRPRLHPPTLTLVARLAWSTRSARSARTVRRAHRLAWSMSRQLAKVRSERRGARADGVKGAYRVAQLADRILQSHPASARRAVSTARSTRTREVISIGVGQRGRVEWTVPVYRVRSPRPNAKSCAHQVCASCQCEPRKCRDRARQRRGRTCVDVGDDGDEASAAADGEGNLRGGKSEEETRQVASSNCAAGLFDCSRDSANPTSCQTDGTWRDTQEVGAYSASAL